MIKKIGRSAIVAASTVVLATGGSALFAGTAFAHDDCGCNDDGGHHHSHHHGHHHKGVRGEGGQGGNGGGANANCLIPVGVSAGVVGQGGDNSQCNASAGAGGSGGNGVSY